MAQANDDEHPLLQRQRPLFEEGDGTLRLIDLFCGCGGLSLGVAQAAHEANIALDVALAIDSDENALAVYVSNFPKANTASFPVEKFINARLGRPKSKKELQFLSEIGTVHAIVGGPPCQGHSDLNNHTRRSDPKNELYLRMCRAAEVFLPAVLLIENVPSVQHSDPDVVGSSRSALRKCGYSVDDVVVSLAHLGVPQTRRRHILLALRIPGITAHEILEAVTSKVMVNRDLRWAIGDLADQPSGRGLDAHPKASTVNVSRMKWMLDNEKHNLPNNLRPPCHQDGTHSYKSMYGRLDWSKPAQTLTRGFTSIGQGRYMHPDQARALTHHEAARIQGFPDYFDFSAVKLRTSLATMIGNAVPPALSFAIFSELLPRLGIR